MSQLGQSSQYDVAKIERIYREWDEALGARDLDAALSLYADDATIESPLVQHLLGTESGICQGKENLRHFINIVLARTPPERRRHRAGFFSDGRTITWEYPRMSPEGDQMDLVEVMKINDDGLIQHHRVYWGWFALGILQDH
jgi:SnoaL-like domain